MSLKEEAIIAIALFRDRRIAEGSTFTGNHNDVVEYIISKTWETCEAHHQQQIDQAKGSFEEWQEDYENAQKRLITADQRVAARSAYQAATLLAQKDRKELVDALESIREMLDADNAESYRADDSEGAMDACYSKATSALRNSGVEVKP